ncbi:hypothetical protein TNCV_3220781 [Trichonephila clavipes]|nr:hypothetical protein TNCV_3220781 [Trichonephila clavipes]
MNIPDENDKRHLESKLDTLKSFRIKLSDIRNEYYEIVENDSDLEPLESEILDLEDDCENIQAAILDSIPATRSTAWRHYPGYHTSSIPLFPVLTGLLNFNFK